MNFKIFLIIASLLIVAKCKDEFFMSFEEICSKYGYNLEKYEVTTNDGYILQTFRIPAGRNQTYTQNRPPVLMKHGAFDSSDAFFIHGGDLSPPFYLANQGFDVWVANTRGDKYSRKHVTLNPDTDPEFWDYSFVEEYQDDIANINLILGVTGHQQLSYIGHSEGTATMITALTTDNADYFKERISLFVALAPIARFSDIKSTLIIWFAKWDISVKIIHLLGIHEWFYQNIYTKTLFNTVCNWFVEVCELNLYLNTEGNLSVIDRTAMRNYFGHFPGGLSVKTLEHEIQMYHQQRFQYFDYGTKGNMEKYGQEQPPAIDPSTISGINIAMIVGKYDLLGDVDDNRWLRDQLGSNVVYYKEYEQGHASFYFAKDMSYLDDIVNLINTYRQDPIL